MASCDGPKGERISIWKWTTQCFSPSICSLLLRILLHSSTISWCYRDFHIKHNSIVLLGKHSTNGCNPYIFFLSHIGSFEWFTFAQNALFCRELTEHKNASNDLFNLQLVPWTLFTFVPKLIHNRNLGLLQECTRLPHPIIDVSVNQMTNAVENLHYTSKRFGFSR